MIFIILEKVNKAKSYLQDKLSENRRNYVQNMTSNLHKDIRDEIDQVLEVNKDEINFLKRKLLIGNFISIKIDFCYLKLLKI